MRIKVIGKAHLKGTSKKSGNPYDFIQVHYNGSAYGVEGVAACTLSLEPEKFSYDDIAIGGDYDVEFGPRGYLVKFAPVTKG